MDTRPEGLTKQEIRDDFVPKVGFLSREFHDLEKERLWPKVWQIACREEELQKVGAQMANMSDVKAADVALVMEQVLVEAGAAEPIPAHE